MDDFERWVRSGLALRGVDVSDVDVQIMRYVDGVFGPMRDALLEADLRGHAAEADLDPSRPPR